MTSCTFPTKSWTWIGFPNAPTTAWILLQRPPRLIPMHSFWRWFWGLHSPFLQLPRSPCEPWYRCYRCWYPANLNPLRDHRRCASEALFLATEQSANRWFATRHTVPANLCTQHHCALSTESHSESAANHCVVCLWIRLADLKNTVASVLIQHPWVHYVEFQFPFLVPLYIFSTFLTNILLETHPSRLAEKR